MQTHHRRTHKNYSNYTDMHRNFFNAIRNVLSKTRSKTTSKSNCFHTQEQSDNAFTKQETQTPSHAEPRGRIQGDPTRTKTFFDNEKKISRPEKRNEPHIRNRILIHIRHRNTQGAEHPIWSTSSKSWNSKTIKKKKFKIISIRLNQINIYQINAI